MALKRTEEGLEGSGGCHCLAHRHTGLHAILGFQAELIQTLGCTPGEKAGVMRMAEGKPIARVMLLKACLDTDI